MKNEPKQYKLNITNLLTTYNQKHYADHGKIITVVDHFHNAIRGVMEGESIPRLFLKSRLIPVVGD